MADEIADWLGQDDDNEDRLRVLVKSLRELQESEGQKYLDKLYSHRYNGIMAGLAAKPLSTLDEALSQEYMKGRAIECLGFGMILEQLIAAFDERIIELADIRKYEDSDNDES